MNTDPERIMLGLPTMQSLAQRFYDAVKSSEGGVSVRDMGRKNPEVCLIDWMHAGQLMELRFKVKHEWSPVKNDPATVQESRYIKIVDPL